MMGAWLKAVVLSVALWTQPYVADGQVAGAPSATITDALERLSQVQRVLLQEVSTAQG